MVAAVPPINISLQPKQALAFKHLENERAIYLLYGGAKFGGKSYLVRAAQVARRLMYPGTIGLIVRRTYPELLGNHIQKFFTEFPFTRKWYLHSAKCIRWPGGSITYFRHLHRTSDVKNFQGIEYDDIDLDEATQHEEEVFKELKTSLRQDPAIARRYPTYRPKFLLTGNPGGIGHAFVKRIWVDRSFRSEEDPSQYAFIQARMYDNPIGVEANPEYAQNLRDLPPDLRKAYLDGDWNIFAGQYFPMLAPDVHLVRPFEIPPIWFRFRSMDWGYGHNGVVLWWAVDPHGHAYIYKRIITKGKTPRQLARMIVEKSDENERWIRTFAGGDMWNRTKTNEADPRETLAKLMRNEGVALSPADTSRVPGWATLSELLNHEKEEPRLRIFRNCEDIYHGLQRMIHDEDHADDCLKMDGDDEADAVRYGAQYLSRGQDLELPKAPIDQVISRIEKANLAAKQEYEEWNPA